jgi:DNA-binding LytR/AlgR family response regulator
MENFTQPETNVVFVGGRLHIPPNEIVMLVAAINYTTIHLIDGQTFIIAKTISRVQDALKSHGRFIRLNKSHVVNWAYVTHLTPEGLLMQNNEILSFSRRRKRTIEMLKTNLE